MADLRRVGKRTLLRLGALLLAVAAVGAIVYEIVFWYNHVHEPNARVMTDYTVLTARADGTIAEIRTARRDRAEAGDLLARMDTTVAELELKSLEADLMVERAARRQVEAERAHFAATLQSRIETERHALRLLGEERNIKRARLEIARADMDRTEQLIGRGAAPELRRDEARDKHLALTGKLHELATRIRHHESRIEELAADRLRDDVYASRIASIDRQIEKLEVTIARKRQEILDKHVHSPVAGVVSEVYANPGQFVEEADVLFLLHDPGAIRVEAYIDEYDIRHVKIGQPVQIELDAYPWQKLRGEVTAIGTVTLAGMTEKAGRSEYVTGSGRVPVVIRFLEVDRPIWPGSRASVNIYIR